MHDTEYTVILKEIRTLMNDVADNMITVRLSLDDYRFHQGKIEVLAVMERYILDLEIKHTGSNSRNPPYGAP